MRSAEEGNGVSSAVVTRRYEGQANFFYENDDRTDQNGIEKLHVLLPGPVFLRAEHTLNGR